MAMHQCGQQLLQYTCRVAVATSRWQATRLCAAPLTALQLTHTRNTHVVKHIVPHKMQSVRPRLQPDPHEAHDIADPRYIYEHLYDTAEYGTKEEPVSILLLSTVKDIGRMGEVVRVHPLKARMELLHPKKGVYASPDNMAKYGDSVQFADVSKQPSSPTVHKIIEYLGGMLVSVCMNLHEPWVLEPWHVRVALRKKGIIVPDDALQLPPETLKGPDLDIEGKMFTVLVTVNKREQVRVRMCFHHVSADVKQRLPWKFFDATNDTPEAVIPREAAYLLALHEQRPPRTAYINPQLIPSEATTAAATAAVADAAPQQPQP